jgi:hypothetical protein
MAKVFSIDGYWKDDNTEFYGLLVAEYNETPEGWDDKDIFFYGLSEEDIKDLIQNDSNEDFVITNFEIFWEG